jgi:hypothetical protein
MKNNLHFWVLCLLALHLQGQTPGVSTFYEQTVGDTRNYIEYIPGNLPIIISVPHGGIVQSGETIGGTFYPDNDSTLPDRTCGNIERDAHTDILVREIQQGIFQRTGCYPHVIINNLHRSKLDPNRAFSEATCGNSNAADYWNAYHNFIWQASATVEANWGKGIYIDLQSQDHAIPRIEVGYNISAISLNTANLNAASIINASTIRNLVTNNTNNLTHEELIRGTNSLGELFQNSSGVLYSSLGLAGCGNSSGYRSIPSATNNGGISCDDTRPQGNPYAENEFYSIRRHGSGTSTSDGIGGSGTIDGILTNVNRRLLDLGTYNGQIYDSQPQILVPFARDYAGVLLNFVNTHYNDFASFRYFSDIYLVNNPNPFPVIGGLTTGTFSAGAGLAINPTTGEIDTANSTPGDYVVTYTVGTCGYFSSSQNITIATDISQDTTPPTAPTNLTAVNITETTTDLLWLASFDNVDLVGYNIYQNDVLLGAVVETNFVATNLAPNTNYTFRITGIDLAGNESASSNEVTITTLQDVQPTYCASGSTSNTDEFISRVQFGDIDNASDAQFYSDFTNIATDLVKNAQYILTVTPEWPISPFDESYAAWIDFNHDGDFNDPGEQIWTQGNTQQSPVSAMITIPTAVPNGVTRMRIAMKYNAAPSPCETFNYGEVEDYTVNIISADQDPVPPVLTLLGENPVQIFVGDTYLDAGATAIDNVDGDLTDVIMVTGTVNTAIAGTYTLYYNVRDTANNEAPEQTRTVNVVVPVDDIPPVITLNGSSSVTLNMGEPYIEQGATAIDNVDGDISANITISAMVDPIVPGTYEMRYNVNDAAGNAAAEVTRTVNILADTTIPVITLNGSSSMTLSVGDTYTELGASATDNIDGDISANIIISGSVNTTVAGVYTITYNVIDAGGNAAIEIIRTITVEEIDLSCDNGIDTFPYTESFENTLGNWTQSTQDDIDWTLFTNSTPSNRTGPTNAIDGNYYLYVEASGNGTGYPDKQAIVTSPCFDLTQLTEATFSFNYHMFGTDMGTFDVEISEDSGATWTSIWTKTASQGNAWQTANIDISAYTGTNVQLRFNRVTGSTWRADIAIDNIRITDEIFTVTGCENGISMFPYNEGYEDTLGGWTQSTDDDIDWTIDRSGTPSNGTGPASAYEGTFYLYVEASVNTVGYPNKQAVITSPCYDLSNTSNASFDFSYHMFGSNNMGSISLEISNDNAQTWTTIWTESGNKGNQWLNESIDLSDYIGGSVQFRFNRVTGSTWQADVAIDNVSVNTTLAARQATSPVKETTTQTQESEEDFAVNSLTLFPNPVRGNILHVKLAYGNVENYRILNLYGQAVASGTNGDQIAVGKLSSGIYFIEISDGNQILKKKFIKE